MKNKNILSEEERENLRNTCQAVVDSYNDLTKFRVLMEQITSEMQANLMQGVAALDDLVKNNGMESFVDKIGEQEIRKKYDH